MTATDTTVTKLQRLVDDAVDEVLNMTDAEIVAEVRARGEDPDVVADVLKHRVMGLVNAYVPYADPKTIGEWVLAKRNHKRLSREQLGATCDLPPQHIAEIETDVRMPTAPLLEQITAALGAESWAVLALLRAQ